MKSNLKFVKTNIRSLILAIILAPKAQAELGSPFSSTVTGLSIPNSHIVSQHSGGRIIRGQAPKNYEIDELVSLGVDRVLIFKNETKNEVTTEISQLKVKGFRSSDILHVDMPWKDISDFQNVCEMTIDSLEFLEESVRSRKTTFFHCTVGEDRTGYLAGLWGLWNGEFRSVNEAFSDEMCQRGYESGDRKKPYAVVKAVRAHLTPAFLKMVKLLSEARQKGLFLRQIKCPRDVTIKSQIPTC